MLLLIRILAIPIRARARRKSPITTTVLLRSRLILPIIPSHREAPRSRSSRPAIFTSRSSFRSTITAGMTLKLIRRMTRVPKATKRPKTRTGMIPPRARTPKPIAVARAV